MYPVLQRNVVDDTQSTENPSEKCVIGHSESCVKNLSEACSRQLLLVIATVSSSELEVNHCDGVQFLAIEKPRGVGTLQRFFVEVEETPLIGAWARSVVLSHLQFCKIELCLTSNDSQLITSMYWHFCLYLLFRSLLRLINFSLLFSIRKNDLSGKSFCKSCGRSNRTRRKRRSFASNWNIDLEFEWKQDWR